MSFRALVLSQAATRKLSGAIETLLVDKLPAAMSRSLSSIRHSNYKDGLVLTTAWWTGENLATRRRH